MKKLMYRSYQVLMRGAMYLLPYNKPQVFYGENSLNEMAETIKQDGHKKVFVAADKGVLALGLCDEIFKALQNHNLEFVIFDGAEVNPTISNVENGLEIYKSNLCSSIIAIGGGSVMDCAKAIGARVSNPNKSVKSMKGILKVRHTLPDLYAIPTTSGTGSETTLAAVIVDDVTREKFVLEDPKLVPKFAVLYPLMTVTLPARLTATTGMDALTHAVESYIGRCNTKQTKEFAEDAIKLIFENLEKAYFEPSNILVRQNMMSASFLAGLAFTRSFVGNVHAIAHSIGGKYNLAHGLLNAIILPKVLSFYGKSIYKKIGTLCDKIGLFQDELTDEDKTIAFINKIKDLNKKFEIPEFITELKEQDIPALTKLAMKEANPLYPVPVIFEEKEFYYIYRSLLQDKD